MKKLNIKIISAVTSLLLMGCSGTEAVAANTNLSNPSISSSEITNNLFEKTSIQSSLGFQIANGTLTYLNVDYPIIDVDGGDRSGHRSNNVAVDIGFGDRQYWGLTNSYGQLTYVLADSIILQDDHTEPVNHDGRYYNDEAAVPGTEHADLDQGHIIADSLGGVANAYNITPQDSVLNRHGDQAYMEKVIRDAGGCTNFVATITYPNTSTQTPSSYKYQYKLLGNLITDEFNNVDPDEYNRTNLASNPVVETPQVSAPTAGNISDIDTNHNGTVTIAEAKAAGFSMPITSDHWLYQYMKDGDGDGMVGE